MKKPDAILILVVLVLTAGCAQKQLGVMTFAEGKVQHVVYAENMPWQPCPPGLPDGCEAIAILEGHPKKADLFTLRFKLAEGFMMPAHFHPKDERVTILSGQLSIAFGKGAKRIDAQPYRAGDYYVNARNEVHTVWVDQPSVIQITGVGPWQSHFID